MADLGFPCPELAEYLSHRTRFNATSEQGIELFGSSGYGDELGAALMHFSSSGEAHGDEFGGCIVEKN